jgi:prolyl-tRNA synthetase
MRVRLTFARALSFRITIEIYICSDIANVERAEYKPQTADTSEQFERRQFNVLGSDRRDDSVVEVCWPSSRKLNEAAARRAIAASSVWRDDSRLMSRPAVAAPARPSLVLGDDALVNNAAFVDQTFRGAELVMAAIAKPQRGDFHTCGGRLHSRRGIEIGQAFLLGQK